MYYGGFTYTEAYNIPVPYKRWFIDRIQREIQGSQTDPNSPGNGNSRAVHHNPPDAMQLAGRTRSQVPSRLRRFS